MTAFNAKIAKTQRGKENGESLQNPCLFALSAFEAMAFSLTAWGLRQRRIGPQGDIGACGTEKAVVGLKPDLQGACAYARY
ncbi:MAG TPA: hypothetical protein PKC23_00540 [Candidatus Desulfobacillus sp.]|nr:hypothetical protein [Candidatus Desulfobacillus sp.]